MGLDEQIGRTSRRIIKIQQLIRKIRDKYGDGAADVLNNAELVCNRVANSLDGYEKANNELREKYYKSTDKLWDVESALRQIVESRKKRSQSGDMAKALM